MREGHGRLLAALVMTATLVVVGPGAPTAAHAGPRTLNEEQQLVLDLVNRERAAVHHRLLHSNATMTQRAQHWAEHLAHCDCLEHRDPPFGTPGGWYAAGENIGRSGVNQPDAETAIRVIHGAFMRSGGHRHNIKLRRWTAIGIGVAEGDSDEWFVVQAYADFTP